MLQCASDVFFKEVRALEKKGFTIDDTTLQYCPSLIPELWPNSKAPAASLRLFRSWNDGWAKNQRLVTWSLFKQVVENNGIKVLMATPVTCDKKDDEQNWQWTKEFMQLIGPDNIMGFAIGNELELLFQEAPENCVNELWDKQRLWKVFQKRVAEIDAMGFGHIPVTTVFTAKVLYTGYPFSNTEDARVKDFLANATSKYGRRYAFTFNIYPYLDPELQMDPGGNGTCNQAMNHVLCWNRPDCAAPNTMRRARRRMEALTGRPDYTFWIGEIGWSSPVADTLSTAMRQCKAFSSVEALSTFYGGFLRWDLSLGSEAGKVVRPPDHVFYFTLRDAMNFGQQEHFGLLTTCEDPDCKVISANWTSPTVVYSIGPAWLNQAMSAVFVFIVVLSVGVWAIVRPGCLPHQKRESREWMELQPQAIVGASSRGSMSDSESSHSSLD